MYNNINIGKDMENLLPKKWNKTIIICIWIILECITVSSGMASNEATPSCKHSDKICEFSWTVTRKQTMLFYEGTHDGGLATPIVSRDRVFYKRPKCASDDTLIPATKQELDQVIMADGSYRYVHTINRQYPGPSIVVYEGQEVVVNVTNRLLQESLTIHWHGMIQHNTNWMDGVAGLTQCAINPMETFTYRFIADPVGTHWYHSHQGLQRSDGLFGSLIVLPNPEKSSTLQGPPDPTFEKEYIASVIDFFPLESNLAYVSFMANQKQFMFDGYNKTGYCYGGAGKQRDGASAGTFRFISALINGKGYQYDSQGHPLVDVPLETYMVTTGKYYRFRVINAAMTYAFAVSIDQHPIVVIASDGGHLVPVNANKVVVNPGETFDFYIFANQTVGNYWLRADTIEANQHMHQTMAVVRYTGAQDVLPTTQDLCDSNPCVIVNCPFSLSTMFAKCINIESLQSREGYNSDQRQNFKEYFIAFEKTRTLGTKKRNAANGIQYMGPSTPPVVLGYDMYEHDCDIMDCTNQPCQCTYQIKVKLYDVIQITMLANKTHPMHLHGNVFKVVKVGYPTYDPVTSHVSGMSADVTCNNDLCNNASWSNKSWYGGNIPGMNLLNPAIKDTVTIPAGGYVVIRFKATNPGWWLFHCHVETHFLQGMGLILKVGDNEDMIPPPKDFNKCGTYSLSHNDFQIAVKKNREQFNSKMSDSWTDREKKLAYGYIGVLLLGIVIGAAVTLIVVNNRSKSAYNPSSAKFSPKEEELVLK